jgi:hypothetical protein
LSDLQNHCRQNLFRYYTYENEIKKKNPLTAEDYCQWHYKCIRAFQSCEFLLNLQNLYARDGSDKARVTQSYSELQSKMQELKGKYDVNSVNPDVIDVVSNEMDSSKADEKKYEDFKLKLVLLSEPNLNAHEALLDKERAIYEALIKKLEQPDCNLNEIKAELSRQCENRLSQLTEQKKMFAAKLEAINKIYEDSTRDQRYLIEGPMPIISLLSRPECNLLQRSMPSPPLPIHSTGPMPVGLILQQQSSTTLTGTTVISESSEPVRPGMRGGGKK